MSFSYLSSVPKFSRITRLVPNFYARTSSVSAADILREKSEIKSFHEIPSPSRIPYFGSYFYFKKHGHARLHETVGSFLRDYGTVVRMKICGETTVYVFDPELAKGIYAMEGRWPEIVPMHAYKERYFNSKGICMGIGNLNGEEWSKVRSSVQGIFMNINLTPAFLPLVTPTIAPLLDKLGQSTEDINMQLSRWNLEATGQRLFETSILVGDLARADSIIRALNEENVASTKLKFSLPWHKLVATPTARSFVEAQDFLHRECEQLMLDAMDRMKGSRSNFIFMTHLMANLKTSLKQITPSMVSFVTDGLNSTVPTIINALYLLASNRDKQDELRKEVDALLPTPDTPITQQHLNDAHYLKACIKETFRIAPSSIEKARRFGHDIILDGFRIPAGTCIHIATNIAAGSERYVDNANTFQPERWLTRHAKSTSQPSIHPYLVMQFSHGPRSCPGRRFAEQDMQLLLMSIVRSYDVSVMTSSGTLPPLRQIFNVLLFPEQQPKFVLTPRCALNKES